MARDSLSSGIYWCKSLGRGSGVWNSGMKQAGGRYSVRRAVSGETLVARRAGA